MFVNLFAVCRFIRCVITSASSFPTFLAPPESGPNAHENRISNGTTAAHSQSNEIREHVWRIRRDQMVSLHNAKATESAVTVRVFINFQLEKKKNYRACGVRRANSSRKD